MFLRYNLFTIVWAVVIFLLILMPGKQLPESGGLFQFDKVAHFAVFAILSFLMNVGFNKQSAIKIVRENSTTFSLGISSFYAASLELSQALVPDRQLSAIDLVANLAGVLVGYLLFLLIYKLSFG